MEYGFKIYYIDLLGYGGPSVGVTHQLFIIIIESEILDAFDFALSIHLACNYIYNFTQKQSSSAHLRDERSPWISLHELRNGKGFSFSFYNVVFIQKIIVCICCCIL